MVNWKSAEATDRLFASLIAGHPNLKLDYHAMATMYGQGATYDAIEGRFRKYRAIADHLRTEAQANGVNVDAPLPCTPRGRAPASTSTSAAASKSKSKSKANLSSSKSTNKNKNLDFSFDSPPPETQTKTSSNTNTKSKKRSKDKGSDAASAINLDSSPSPEFEAKHDADLFVKMEEPKTERFSSACSSPRKPRNLVAGSVTPLKRSVEGIENADGSPTPRVKMERRAEMENPFALGVGDSSALSDPFVDYYEGAA